MRAGLGRRACGRLRAGVRPAVVADKGPGRGVVGAEATQAIGDRGVIIAAIGIAAIVITIATTIAKEPELVPDNATAAVVMVAEIVAARAAAGAHANMIAAAHARMTAAASAAATTASIAAASSTTSASSATAATAYQCEEIAIAMGDGKRRRLRPRRERGSGKCAGGEQS